MKRFLVRAKCEYSTVVWAESPSDAVVIAEARPIDQWDEDWYGEITSLISATTEAAE